MVSVDQFIQVWNASETLTEVASRLNITKGSACSRACKLRSSGHPVKKLSSNHPRGLAVRLWAKVVKGPGCWIWTGAKNKKGYGEIQKGRRGMGPIPTHRASWIIHFGEISDDLQVLHHCDNPSCVRPDHLFLGTAADNTADMIKKQRGHWQMKAPRKMAAA